MDYQRRLDISSLKQSENPIILELKVSFCHVVQVPCWSSLEDQCLISRFPAESGPDQENNGARGTAFMESQ